MRDKKMRRFAVALALVFGLCVMAAATAFAEATAAEDTVAEPEEQAQQEAAPAQPTPAPAQGSADTMYVGEIATRIEDKWECSTSFAVKGSVQKSYATMVGNVLRLTVYSTVPQGVESDLYIPMDSHISYVDGTDRFALVGTSGEFYCYQKLVQVTAAGSFSLTVASTNQTLYSGVYDTVSVEAYDTIESLEFFVESGAANEAETDFFVTANGSSTALITPDTTGFNATDNEWKIVTAENTEKVLFSDTAYNGYTFDPQTISLTIFADANAQANPTTLQVYYLGLVNGKLYTVGPYTFPASANSYSRSFELASSNIDVLAADNTITFYGYIDEGRTPEITVTDVDGIATLQNVELVESDVAGKSKVAITVGLSSTGNDLDLLVGNRWSVNEIAYNYRTLRVRFLHTVQSLSLSAVQTGHYQVDYTAAVNGQTNLDTGAVNWYINNVQQPEHGLTMSRTFERGGTYAVYAELGGLTSNTVTSSIIYASWQAAVWYSALALVILLAVLAWMARRRSTGAALDVRIRERLTELQETCDATRAALATGQQTQAAVARLRGLARQLTWLQDSLYARFNATNMQLYQVAAKRIAGQRAAVERALHSGNTDPYYIKAVYNTLSETLTAARDDIRDLAMMTLK